jgi:uncharacterized protein YfaS (alpha-2-macroglobulin family)
VVSTSTTTTPSISVSTDQSSYNPGQTVAVRVSLQSGASPDVGASVTANIITPSGKTTILTGTTGSNGLASLSYKISKRAAAGTYQVLATTTATGSTASVKANTTFSVQ